MEHFNTVMFSDPSVSNLYELKLEANPPKSLAEQVALIRTFLRSRKANSALTGGALHSANVAKADPNKNKRQPRSAAASAHPPIRIRRELTTRRTPTARRLSGSRVCLSASSARNTSTPIASARRRASSPSRSPSCLSLPLFRYRSRNPSSSASPKMPSGSSMLARVTSVMSCNEA